jgi:hypothetical protein
MAFDYVDHPKASSAIRDGELERMRAVARAAHIRIIGLDDRLREPATFSAPDGLHRTEPVHRLLAKRWLEALLSEGVEDRLSGDYDRTERSHGGDG